MSIHREILRHVLALKLSGNETHAVLNVSRGSVQTCVRRAAETDLTWADVESLSDSDLAALLFPEKASKDKVAVDSAIDWERVYAELKRKGVKLKLLYAERVESEGLQLSYSQFCRQFKKWTAAQMISMRQEHTAGEKLFVDFSGMTVDLTNPETGEVTKVQIFVATLGASNYTYFEAVPSQKLQDWIECHVRALKFFRRSYEIPDTRQSQVGCN